MKTNTRKKAPEPEHRDEMLLGLTLPEAEHILATLDDMAGCCGRKKWHKENDRIRAKVRRAVEAAWQG